MMNFLKGKRLIWTPYFRVFCDGGQPRFTALPSFRPQYYDKYWRMTGFAVYFLGREFNFSFGKDENGLYR